MSEKASRLGRSFDGCSYITGRAENAIIHTLIFISASKNKFSRRAAAAEAANRHSWPAGTPLARREPANSMLPRQALRGKLYLESSPGAFRAKSPASPAGKHIDFLRFFGQRVYPKPVSKT
jgi:hypothetical protein